MLPTNSSECNVKHVRCRQQQHRPTTTIYGNRNHSPDEQRCRNTTTRRENGLKIRLSTVRSCRSNNTRVLPVTTTRNSSTITIIPNTTTSSRSSSNQTDDSSIGNLNNNHFYSFLKQWNRKEDEMIFNPTPTATKDQSNSSIRYDKDKLFVQRVCNNNSSDNNRRNCNKYCFSNKSNDNTTNKKYLAWILVQNKPTNRSIDGDVDEDEYDDDVNLDNYNHNNHDSNDDDDDCYGTTSISNPNKQMAQFQKHATESIQRVYNMDTCTRRVTNSGSLQTSLPEDIMIFLHNFVTVLETYFLRNNSYNNHHHHHHVQCGNNINNPSSVQNNRRKRKVEQWASRCFRTKRVALTAETQPHHQYHQKQQQQRQQQHHQNSPTSIEHDDDDDILDMHSYFVDGLIVVIQIIADIHCSYRSKFTTMMNDSTRVDTNIYTIEDVCAMANDYFRLSEQIETFCTKITNMYPFVAETTFVNESYDLSRMLLQDSIDTMNEQCQWYYFIEKTYTSVKTTTSLLVSEQLFTIQWENVYTNNEVICTLRDHLDQHLQTLYRYLDNDYLYNKALLGCVKATVSFYVRCLLTKAGELCCSRNRYKQQQQHHQQQPQQQQYLRNVLDGCRITTFERGSASVLSPVFQHHDRAMMRMAGDITIMVQYFRNLVEAKYSHDCSQDNYNNHPMNTSTTNPTCDSLIRMITNEMWVLEVMHEYMIQCGNAATCYKEEPIPLECTNATISTSCSSSNSNNNNNSNYYYIDASTITTIENLIVILHKRTGGNVAVTRYLVSDLWFLSNSPIYVRSIILHAVDRLENDLNLVTSHLSLKSTKEQTSTTSTTIRSKLPSSSTKTTTTVHANDGQLDVMLKRLYKKRSKKGFGPFCWSTAPPSSSNNCDNRNHTVTDMASTIQKNMDTMIQTIVQNINEYTKHVTTTSATTSNSPDVIKQQQQQQQRDYNTKTNNTYITMTKDVPIKKKKSTRKFCSKKSLYKLSNQGIQTIETILSKMVL